MSQATSQPENILAAWATLEVLSPAIFKNPLDLAGGDPRRLFRLGPNRLPWADGVDRSQKHYRLYYQIVLGSILMPRAIEELLKVYADRREERPAAPGEAVLAMLTVDYLGRPVGGVEGTGLSSFGWAVPVALAGRPREVGNWLREEEPLKSELDMRACQFDEEGELRPLNWPLLAEIRAWLTERLGLPARMVKGDMLAISAYQHRSVEEPPEPLLLNSFFLTDLAAAGRLARRQALTGNLKLYLGLTRPKGRKNLLEDRPALVSALEPQKLPRGAWPSPSRSPLALLQQAAVNLAGADLKKEGLLAVNGPPGTGKTTLLRDLVAALITRRAQVLLEFDDPAAAFRFSGQRLEKATVHIPLFQLSNKLRGWEIIVASSNNKAVENISRELPARANVEEGLEYFKSVADAVLQTETWGLVSAVLGNSKNRSRFYKKFWRDKDWGFHTYLRQAAGYAQFVEDEDGRRRRPQVILTEKPPFGREEALERWRQTRAEFGRLLAETEDKINFVQKLHNLQSALAKKRLTGGLDRARLQAEYQQLAAQYGGLSLDESFFQKTAAERHLANPWLDQESAELRRKVFQAALGLTRAFIDAAAIPIRHNLMALFDRAWRSGAALPDDLFADLWATLFLVVPVISTTFASVGRMFRLIPPKSLGWLLIDEAGQALPQAAVGAIMRTKRVVVVGDPLQIPPVTVLPENLTEAVCRDFQVEPRLFNPPGASVQTLADRASKYYTAFETIDGRREVGLPLLVHRRCAEPMFAIANAVAYENMMIQAKRPGASAILDILGPSRWINVEGTGFDKWCEEEGAAAIRLLSFLKARGTRPDLYLVTPFVAVQNQLRLRFLESGLLEGWTDDPRRWVSEHVGTVHTVQGREAEAVFFILGAPRPEQTGARHWAGATPNLLNVAVTRAKEALYVIGNDKLWREAGLFKTLWSILASSAQGQES